MYENIKIVKVNYHETLLGTASYLAVSSPGRSSAGAVQAVCNGPSMSAAQSTTVHDGLLHPHLRHCSSSASAVRRLPSAVRTAKPAFSRRAFSAADPAAWNSLPDYLRDPSRSFGSFYRDSKTSFLVLLTYTAHQRLAIMC